MEGCKDLPGDFFSKGDNPIHEDSAFMTQVPPKFPFYNAIIFGTWDVNMLILEEHIQTIDSYT